MSVLRESKNLVTSEPTKKSITNFYNALPWKRVRIKILMQPVHG